MAYFAKKPRKDKPDFRWIQGRSHRDFCPNKIVLKIKRGKINCVLKKLMKLLVYQIDNNILK